MDNTKYVLANKDKQLESTEESVEQINNKYQVAQDEIKALKKRIKGNMSLIEARRIIWDDIISEIKSIWEHMNLVSKEKVVFKGVEFFILSPKNEDAKNAKTVEKFTRYLNENEPMNS